MQAPEHVVGFEDLDQFVRGGFGEVELLARLAGGIDEPINSAVDFVAQRGFIGAAFAGFEAARDRIVLDDVVVPVDEPERAVGPDFGGDRSSPFIIGSECVKVVASGEARAIGLHDELAEQMAGGLALEGNTIPIFGRKGAGGVKRVACAGSVCAVLIDLADFFGDGIETRGVGHGRQPANRQAADLFVIAVGNVKVETGLLLAVEPKTRLSSESPRPHVLLLLEPRNSRAEPSGFMRKRPWPKETYLPPTVPRKPL